MAARHQVTLQQIQSFDELVRLFLKLPPIRKKPKTIWEISRFPHSELVSSNVLSFFIDPNEEHGLDDLVLRSLFEAARSNLVDGDLHVLEVIREEVTDSGKRIDLVIRGSAFIVAIENKLYHHAKANPFDDYNKHLKNLAKQHSITPRRSRPRRLMQPATIRAKATP